ncbi:MAG: DUF58 domain-containing protein [Planctomycetota bacterium]
MSRLFTSTTRAPRPRTKRSLADWLKWVALEDHCEWANRYVAWLKTPLGVLLVGAFVSLLSGLFVAPQGFALLAGIVMVIAVGLAWPWIAMRGIHAQLEFASRRGREGKPTVAKFVVSNRWPWPVWGLAVDDPFTADSSEAAALARIDGWSRATFDCTFTPSMRGAYPRKSVLIGTAFPFGLWRASRPVKSEKRLIVWPQTFWLPPLGDSSSRVDWRGVLSEDRAGAEGFRLGTREHRHGDTLRDVHWAKSARYDRLIVSEREASVVPEIAVFVDTDPARHSAAGGDSTLEWSLRIAASICESVVEKQGGVQLWLGNKRVCAHSTELHLQRLLDEIALLHQDGAESSQSGGAPQLSNAPGIRVSIGTHLSPIRTNRAIVLSGYGFGGKQERDDINGWIVVDTPEDVADQILKGWRNGTRRVSRAR